MVVAVQLIKQPPLGRLIRRCGDESKIDYVLPGSISEHEVESRYGGRLGTYRLC
jgi:hypothetical protein